MRRTTIGLLSLTLATGLGVSVSSPAVMATPAPGTGVVAGVKGSVPDELPNPREDKRRALRQEAVTQVLNGEAVPQVINGSTVVKVGETASVPTAGRAGTKKAVKRPVKNQYVELSREKKDKIFVILAEFGDQRDANYPDQDTDPATPGPLVFDGPLHNAIPAPDRTKDNSTVWQADYTADYYRKLYFGKGKGVESVKTYYETQSSGRYTVNGEVTDWVKVPFNEARYGRSDGYPCASNVCSNTWDLIKDAINVWVADKKAGGATDASIKAELASFDQWDRYDYDGDGNFNEPDGYLDHFQIVHAGGDQADGDPQQGEDAIWSHRWKAFQGTGQGPAGHPDGGTQIGNTGLWVADYTIQPENGGLSVFTHEYAHDLGLPDDYNSINGGDNNNEYWTLMAQSRLNAAGEPLGTRPGDLGAWNKLQLGWLDYETVVAGQKKTLKLGPQEYNTAKAQAAVVVLPKKVVTTANQPPFAESKTWYSGTGDDYEASMSRSLTLPSAPATLSFQAAWNIEDCGADPCDYAYVEVDDGTGWKAVSGSITSAAEGNGIDGSSAGAWKPATFDLSAYASKTIGLRVHYLTDGGQQGNPKDTNPPGIFVDAIAIEAGGQTLFSDGAEQGVNGWALSGFSAIGATSEQLFDNYYIAGHRSYVSYDKYLKTGPYNFGFPTTRPDFVEHYAYQTGLLISYWDTSYSDNDTVEHPGHGRNMIIDSRPKTMYNLCGTPWRSRVQMYDAPFSLHKAGSMTLHCGANERASYVRGQAAQPLFDDTKTYWYADQPNHGVILPKAGVKIKVLEERGTSMNIRVS